MYIEIKSITKHLLTYFFIIIITNNSIIYYYYGLYNTVNMD